MSEARIEAGDAQTWRITGDLVFATANGLLREADALRKAGGWPRVLDLQAVTRGDSAGLALLLEWLSLARREQIDLRFHNPPTQLLHIAQASGLDTLLLGQDGQAA